MSETNDSGDKTLRGSGKPLTLSVNRTVEAGHVRQNFSHGRSKPVVVQKMRRRTISSPGQGEDGGEAPAAEVEAKPAQVVEPVVPKRAQSGRARLPGRDDRSSTSPSAPTVPGGRTLSDGEKDARLKALAAAKAREAEDRRRAEEDAKRRAEEDERRRIEKEERLRAEAEAEAKARQEARQEEGGTAVSDETAEAAASAAPVAEAKPAAKPKAPTTAKAPTKAPVVDLAQPAPPVDGEVRRTAAPAARKIERLADETEEEAGKRTNALKKAKPAVPVRKVDDRKGRGRLTITNALEENQRERSLASLRRHTERQKKRAAGIMLSRDKIAREVIIPEVITIQELANRMAERSVDVIKFLMKQGEMHKINDVIDTDMAELIVAEFGHTAKRVSEADVEEGFISAVDDGDDLVSRAPVVTIMGHVDHGKTSLLDAIRHANVVSGEAGGITQHIGAYQVTTPSGDKVTFIDTPGHAAFTAMRARGAKVTDIVVLVVAADDGVMPQTVEAINHAKSAGVPIIVAINKIDKPAAEPQRVRTELLNHEIVVESMSGETLEVEVSALQRLGLDDLLEAISMQAELLDLRAKSNRSAEGVVIEAQLERGRGPVGTMLVQRGTLKVGNIIVAGTAWGKVRALINDRGENTVDAGPSVPVEVLGLNSAPEAGDQFAVVESEARAREITDYRTRKRRERMAPGAGTVRTLEQMMSQLKEVGKKEFPIVIKGDVQGSVEAIANALDKLGTDEVTARVVHSGVGAITESDIALATASNAVILGFNVRPNVQAKQAAERDGVEIRYYSIIYNLVDDVKAAMSGLLDPTIKETFIGYAQILQVFDVSKVGKVAGCRVTEGRVERGAGVRLLRDNIVIHEGKLSTLKRFKDEVKEVHGGQECGMAFEKYEDIREGDRIECFTTEKVIRTL